MPLSPRKWVLALLLASLPCELVAQAMTPARGCGSAPFVMRNVRLFDGERVTARIDVYVRDTLITRVGLNLRVPPGTSSCDGAGHTLMPGLFDGHAHVNDRTNLEEALLFGVTTELDMFAQLDTITALRKSGLLNSGNILADFRSAGTLVTTAGGHGTEFGFSIPTLQSPDSAEAFIDHRLAEGSNYIKIVYDNGTEWGFTGPMLDSATMAAAIAAAKKRRVLSIVHIGSYRGAVTALEAGADGIAHIFGDSMPDGNYGNLVAAHKAFVMTTLTPLGQMSADSTWGIDAMLRDSAVAKRMDPAQDSSMENRFTPAIQARMQVAQRVAQELRAANVPVIAGSDSPAPGTAHGITLHIELRNMVRAGFTPIEALRSATSIPARIFGLTDRGRVARGLRSDLLLVQGDPTVNINTTLQIARVWKRGRLVNRSHNSFNTRLAAAVRQSPSVTVFRPLRKVMAPPVFFGFTGVEFLTRGDGKSYGVALELSDGTSSAPREFSTQAEWKSVRMAFADFGVTNTGRITGVRFFANDSAAVKGSFLIERVRPW